MSDTSKREELIEEAAKAIKPRFDDYCVDADAEDHAWEAAEAALSVFEQAHTPTDKSLDITLNNLLIEDVKPMYTPTDDEREELLLEKIKTAGHVMSEGMIYPYSSYMVKAIPYTRFLDMLAGFRRTAVQEPSAEPTEAMVEAGAREAFFTDDAGGHIRGGYTWDTIPEIGRQNYRTMVRAVLHAALTAAYETKGEGR